jgi:hypothetical protein
MEDKMEINEEMYEDMKTLLQGIHNNAASAVWMGFHISAEVVASRVEEFAAKYPNDFYLTF